jgi:hypothetical protein
LPASGWLSCEDEVARDDVQELDKVSVAFGIPASEVKVAQCNLNDVFARESPRSDGEAVIGNETVFDSIQASNSTIVVVKFKREFNSSHGVGG